ncbi:hypothetical protein NONI108955_00035 [Nocardia ninae]
MPTLNGASIRVPGRRTYLKYRLDVEPPTAAARAEPHGPPSPMAGSKL